MNLAYTNDCQLYVAFMQILIITHRWKFEEIFGYLKSVRQGLLNKLESIGTSENLLNLFRSFLNDRYQRVVINGQHSDGAPILAGVPQGSILGPLLFLIYINDLPDNLNSLVNFFADDASLFSTDMILLLLQKY